jgi:hypothetical protein
MTISKLSDEQVFASIESIESSGDEEKLVFGFAINKTFFVYVRAGKGTSIPERMLDHLSEYSKVTMELYHYKDPPPIEETHMDPIEFECPEPDGTIKVYRFTFDVQCFPHIGINPVHEEPFKSQPWAAAFQRGSWIGYTALLPIKDVCDIIRYLDKISRLKLFW